MKRKIKKRARKVAKKTPELKSYASLYAARLARQVRAELGPRRAAPDKGKKLRLGADG